MVSNGAGKKFLTCPDCQILLEHNIVFDATIPTAATVSANSTTACGMMTPSLRPEFLANITWGLVNDLGKKPQMMLDDEGGRKICWVGTVVLAPAGGWCGITWSKAQMLEDEGGQKDINGEKKREQEEKRQKGA